MGDQIYVAYNSMVIMLFVGQYAPAEMISTIFKVDDINSINMMMSEEEIFADVE